MPVTISTMTSRRRRVLSVSVSGAPTKSTSPAAVLAASTRNSGPPASLDGAKKKASAGWVGVGAEKPETTAGSFGA